MQDSQRSHVVSGPHVGTYLPCGSAELLYNMLLSHAVCLYAASDSDENDMPSHATKPADATAGSNFPSKLHGTRIVKYNFLDLSK